MSLESKISSDGSISEDKTHLSQDKKEPFEKQPPESGTTPGTLIHNSPTDSTSLPKTDPAMIPVAAKPTPRVSSAILIKSDSAISKSNDSEDPEMKENRLLDDLNKDAVIDTSSMQTNEEHRRHEAMKEAQRSYFSNSKKNFRTPHRFPHSKFSKLEKTISSESESRGTGIPRSLP